MIELLTTMIRVDRLTQSAIRAYGEGATADQLADYLVEIAHVLSGGGDDEANSEPADP